MDIDTNRLAFYLLLIKPDSEVFEDAVEFKREFVALSGWVRAQWSKPHFSVCSFHQWERYEKRLIEKLEQVAYHTFPIIFYLTNFQHFHNKRTKKYVISIPVFDVSGGGNQAFVILSKKIGDRLKGFVLNREKQIIADPHLTIAKDIPQEIFTKVWPKWESKCYQNQFTAQKMILLKKYPSEKYQFVKEFRFLGEGPEPSPEQGKLF